MSILRIMPPKFLLHSDGEIGLAELQRSNFGDSEASSSKGTSCDLDNPISAISFCAPRRSLSESVRRMELLGSLAGLIMVASGEDGVSGAW